MEQYQELLKEVLETGVQKGDRTGTGTLSIFVSTKRYDLRAGFPLVTTKKTAFRIIAEELFWFLRGDTKLRSLLLKNINIWNKDAYRSYSNSNFFQGETYEEYIELVREDEDYGNAYGDLGTIYGWSWRTWGKKPERILQPVPRLKGGLKKTYLGVANGKNKERDILGKTWEGLIARCYDKNNSSYSNYGGRGVYVCDSWLEFSVFSEEVKSIPGWLEKENSSTRYVLDKDIKGDGFCYSKENCMWVTDKANIGDTLKYLYTVEKNGVEYEFTNITEFCKAHNAEGKNFSDLWTGNKKAKLRNGFKLVSVQTIDKGTDQIANVIKSIKEDPDSRRHLISSWNVSQLKFMSLPPCHAMFQFYVNDGVLSLYLYQRSGDAFLGIPYNIASYSLLLMLVAKHTGLIAGEFIHTIGDLHLYNNHIEQAQLQLTREPRELPTLNILNDRENIWDYQLEDFELVGYDPHPAIKAEQSS